MRLTFDRGTVVLTKDGESLDLANIPGVYGTREVDSLAENLLGRVR